MIYSVAVFVILEFCLQFAGLMVCCLAADCWCWMRWIHWTARVKRSSTPSLNIHHLPSQNSFSLVSCWYILCVLIG